MSLLQSIVKNTFLLTTGRICAKVLSAVFIAFLARAVGPAGVGKYAYAVSLIAIFMLLPDFGFDMLLVREGAKAKFKREELVGNILTIKIVLTLITFFLLLTFIKLRQYDNQTMVLILLVLGSAILSTILQTFYSIFRASERMEFEALLVVLKNSLLVIFGVTAIKFGLKLSGIISALVVADVLSLSFGIYITQRNFIRLRSKPKNDMIKRIVKAAIPFGLLVIVEVVFINTDTLMIAKFEGEMAVGWYAASVKLLMMLYLIPHMFMNAIFPVLSRLSVSSADSLRQTYTKSFSYMLISGFPIAIGGFLVSDQIIMFIYGEQFRNSILIFQIMVWVTMWSFVGFVNGATLNAIGKERLFALMQSCFAISNIFLDYFLIRRFGYIGVCYATLILTGLGFFIYSIICHRQLGIRPEWYIIGKSSMASMIMGAIVYIMKEISTNIFIVIPVGALTYLALILLLGVLPAEDIKALRNLAYRYKVSLSL